MSVRTRVILSMFAMATAGLLATRAAAGPGVANSDTAGGRAAFEKRCTGCHALDKEKVGPRLAGVVGRKAGSVSAYPYSDALKKSGVIWSEAVLDKWLDDPESVIPNTDMTFRLSNSSERTAIIAFLKETGK
jgi:cytochrome c